MSVFRSRRTLLFITLLVSAAAALIVLPRLVPTKSPSSKPVATSPAAPGDAGGETAPQPDAPLVFQAVPPETAEVLNDARPDYIGTLATASALHVSGPPDSTARALDCLTAAIYYEARSETLQGQRAVAQVVLNRARDPLYPSSICGVVFQGAERSTGCQFSFTCDGSMAVPPRPELWQSSRAIANAALAGYVERSVGLATHYHTRWVVPVWRTDLVKLRTIGAHIFYGWRGRERSARGLRSGYAGMEPPLWPSLVPYALASADDMLPTDPTIATFAQSPAEAGDGPAVPATGLRPSTTPLQADERRGALVAGGSKLRIDDNAPVPLSALQSQSDRTAPQ